MFFTGFGMDIFVCGDCRGAVKARHDPTGCDGRFDFILGIYIILRFTGRELTCLFRLGRGGGFYKLPMVFNILNFRLHFLGLFPWGKKK